MARFHPSSPAGAAHFRLWGSTLRRKIINSVRCGGRSSGSHGRRSDVNPLPPEPPKEPGIGSEKASMRLLDHLNRPLSLQPVEVVNADHGTTDARKEEEEFGEFSKATRLLRSELALEREIGAKMVRRMTKEDREARRTLAMLGAIPPLVGMVDDGELRVYALYALLNLGIGNDMNKAVIVQAGLIHKMLKIIESSDGHPDSAVSEIIVANFLALSALDSNKPIIGSSGAIPFLVDTLKDLGITCHSDSPAKHDTLRTLYNLSILASNIPSILETDLVPYLINILSDTEISERILSILTNIVAVPEGRKALSAVSITFPALIDVLSWTDYPLCQEKASYILLVMAHKVSNDRLRMIEAGIISALLELILIGSTLSQKRASRIFDCLMNDKGKRVLDVDNLTGVYNVSSLSCLGLSNGLKAGLEGDGAVKQLVQQSLQTNMRKIVKRANLQSDYLPSGHFKSLNFSSTSKSLTF